MLSRPAYFLPLILIACSGGNRDPVNVPADFVGSAACAGCHTAEAASWRGSDHDLAMQQATEETVLGDFDDAMFAYGSLVSTFFRQGGGFHVRTDGPQGEPAGYRIAYTFGVDPLQQYLIPFRDGRLQVLGIAWDTRPARDGGQRWFHLYPGEAIDHEDELHWTRNAQTWNHACAECHTTGLQKGYDLETDGYGTTWQEIDVGCEACHGPGSRHVAWARSSTEDGRAADGGDSGPGDRGLPVAFRERRGVEWMPDRATGIARRSQPPGRRIEIEACARCHSLRTSIRGDYEWGRHLLATHRPELILEGLYFPDGQIRDEVYEYGSFRQSRMYRAGVTCSDCHDPHGLKLRAEGNAVCAACHDPARFDSPDHHFHPAGSEGSRCVECHMPSRIYMQVDQRRDHSLGIPRPDLSERLGTPNACTSCHTNRSNAWAVASMEEWRGGGEEKPRGFAEVFAADDRRLPVAAAGLVRVASDPEVSGIVRASALARLAKWPDAIAPALIEGALADPEPLVRFGAVLAVEAAEPSRRLALAAPALADTVPGVRQEAARILAPLPDSLLTVHQRGAFDRAAAEYVDGLMAQADRSWALLELAAFRASRGEMEPAIGVLRRGLEIHPDDPDLLAGMVTAARATGQPARALKYAERLQARFPDNPEIRLLVEELRGDSER